jgi:hypothetical protein
MKQRRNRMQSGVGDWTYTFIRISLWTLIGLGIGYFLYVCLIHGPDTPMRMVKSPTLSALTWLTFYLILFAIMAIYEVVNYIRALRQAKSQTDRRRV